MAAAKMENTNITLEVFDENSCSEGKKYRSLTFTFEEETCESKNQTSFAFEKVENGLQTLRKLPSATQVFGRFLFLRDVQKIRASRESSSQIALELEQCWIKYQIYPIGRTSIVNKVDKMVKTFLYLIANKKSKKNTPKYKTETFEAYTILSQPGFDIKTNDEKRIKSLEEEYGVKMTDTDLQFYYDNITGSRKMCALQDLKWEKEKRKEVKILDQLEKKRQKLEENIQKQKEKQQGAYGQDSFE